jgi:hypothetical protein
MRKPKTLRAQDVERLENTSFAGALVGVADAGLAMPESSTCCPCTACSEGTLIIPNPQDLLCGSGLTCTSGNTVDTTAYVTPLVPTVCCPCSAGSVAGPLGGA